MGNKKKRSKIADSKYHSSDTQSQSNDRVIPVPFNIQSSDSFKVKQENDIKQEPVSVSLVVEVPAPTYRKVTYVPGFNERNARCDFDHLNLEEVKSVVKKECDDKKEEDPKTNDDSGEEATDGQSDQQPPTQGEDDSTQPESDTDAQNTQKIASEVPKNTRKRHKCDFCEYSTPRKGHLNLHLLKHTGERPHECKFCPKRFTTKQYLRAHMKVHVEEFLFTCSVCLQGFNEKDEKTVHEMNCNIRRYECYLCKDSFGSLKVHMIDHMYVHSGNKPFECNECFKQFTQKSHLNIHMRIHAGPRSFRCPKCHEGFSQQDEKKAHEKKCSRHAYECDICGKTFGLKKSNLISHMRIHSGEKPFQCKDCPKKFAAKRDLNKHMKMHTKKLQFKCLVCRQGFKKDNKRRAHQRNCDGRYYECYLCNKFFHSLKTNLKIHMHIHSGEKPFRCELCCNTFTSKGNLKKHTKNIHNKKH